jgi:hypothetical protein
MGFSEGEEPRMSIYSLSSASKGFNWMRFPGAFLHVWMPLGRPQVTCDGGAKLMGNLILIRKYKAT